MIRVFFACRPQIFSVPGGDTVQLLKMKQFLAPLGVDATISSDPSMIQRDSVDLVHVFNLFDIESTFRHVEQARRQSTPVVITPNYWNPLEFFFHTSPSVLHRLFRAMLPQQTGLDFYRKHKLNRMKTEIAAQRQILAATRLILPNSNAEAAELQRDFNQSAEKFHVVYNAVDVAEVEAASADGFVAQYGIRDFVLCVGRFEERKNQLGVIQALAGLQVPLVFIGGVPEYQRSYFAACQRAAAKIPQTLFLSGLPQQEVFGAMKAAKVHVLGSWWENTGLVSLEASLCGCNVVATNRAPWQEYFGNAAWICDPADPASLQIAVNAALAAPVSVILAERIRQDFTWDHSAQVLKKAYEAVLQESGQ